MLVAGTFLNERYEIVRKIGVGGMADVYRGKDHKLRRHVAIKVLKREFNEDSTFIKKFEIEAQAAAGILHPNVVNVYDVGYDLDYHYMVMELVDGITLKEYIQKKGKLGDKEVISIAIQVAAGLEAAHNRNIVHRDIKPQNVMISREGKVKVTDFGIAKPSASENTVNANVMGSVHYTSPEQARGSACDVQSDIYSLGVTLYEMITGTVPFDGDSTVAIAVKHLQEEMLPPSEYEPEMYYSLEQIILKCTQKNASRRYADMSALVLDLKRALVEPDGDFVNIAGLAYGTGNVSVSRNQPSGIAHEYDDEYDDDEYDDDDGYEDRRNARRSKSEEVDPGMKKVTKILTIVAAVLVAFALLFIVARAVGFFQFGPGDATEQEVEDGEVVKMVNLEGETEESAKSIVEGMGLKFSVKSVEESLKYDKGIVVNQDVKSGEDVTVGSTINVIVSAGLTKETVPVPSILGMSEANAQKMLNEADLTMSPTMEYSADVPQGNIISVDPAVGTEVAKKSTVNVVVSKGQEPIPTTKVPDLFGKSESAAKQLLTDAKLTVGNKTEAFSDTVAAGDVMEQSVAAGKDVDEGTTVNYTVSKGQEVQMVSMPTVVGKPEEQAVGLLESTDYDFTVTVTESYSSSVTAGVVISANYSAGTSVPKGSSTTVTLEVSIGPKPVDKPTEEDTDTGAQGTTN